LVARKEGGVDEGKIALLKLEKEKFVEPQPTKEWIQAVKKGKVVAETPDYIIKEYKGYQYFISKKPTGLPTQKPEGELIDVFRIEKKGTAKIGASKGGKYAIMEVDIRKGYSIPVKRKRHQKVCLNQHLLNLIKTETSFKRIG
jgi:hypothetical protein